MLESLTMLPANMIKLWALINSRHLLVSKHTSRRLNNLFLIEPVNRISACLFSIDMKPFITEQAYIQPWTILIERILVPRTKRSNSLRKDMTHRSLTQHLSTIMIQEKSLLIKDRSCKTLTLHQFFRTQLRIQALLVIILKEVWEEQLISKTVSLVPSTLHSLSWSKAHSCSLTKTAKSLSTCQSRLWFRQEG